MPFPHPVTSPSNVPSLCLQHFLAPVSSLLAKAKNQRSCPELSDQQWLQLGLRRVLEDHPSGRAFLQTLSVSGCATPSLSHFFESLKSGRRLALLTEVSNAFAKTLPSLLTASWESLPELSNMDLYAGDGHFQEAAVHDSPDLEKGSKYATGHFFALNLRSHALVHLTVADQLTRKKEHDMHALKRLSLSELRQGAKNGRKVLYVWDRAGIDFSKWQYWKNTGGLYFLSREKANMALRFFKANEWDPTDPRNQGVLADEMVTSSKGVQVRRVRYWCVLRGEEFSFLSSEYRMPPGVLAHLYRLRWDIEKVFDELKNKVGETKAWASSATAKAMQANFLCLGHNLLLLCEAELEREHGIRNEAELARRAKRLQEEAERLGKEGHVLPMLIETFQRLTQRSVKFVRWLRVQLFGAPQDRLNILLLRRLYAVL